MISKKMLTKTKKDMEYKDKEGNTLYGFSQVHLERTNNRLNDMVLGLKLLIILFVVLLVGMAAFMGWIAYNDIVTRLITGN